MTPQDYDDLLPDHSILLSYKDRPEHLSLWLDCYREALKSAQKKWQLVMVDLSKNPLDPQTFDGLPAHSNIDMTAFKGVHYIHQPLNGQFYRAKALNCAARSAYSRFITIIDVDCMMPPNFLRSIEKFYTPAARRNHKLYHRIRASSPQIAEQWRKQKKITLPDDWRTWNKVSETYKETTCGTSQFTMGHQRFIDMQGFDERFRGWAPEDVEFNMRYVRCWGQPTLNQEAELVHVHHAPDRDKPTQDRGRQLLQEQERNNFGNPPREIDWGAFYTYEWIRVNDPVEQKRIDEAYAKGERTWKDAYRVS